MEKRFTERFRYAYNAVELQIAPDRMTVTALGREKEVIDSFTIEKSGARPELKFARGDADGDSRLTVADPIRILHHLFLGRPMFCPLVGDVDGSGLPLQINDPIYLLDYLFLGGPAPAAPFPACGTVPDADDGFCYHAGCR